MRESASKIVLIRLSSGDEDDRDGDTFTSRSHGLNLLSIIISKPYISKQPLFVEVGKPLLLMLPKSPPDHACAHAAWKRLAGLASPHEVARPPGLALPAGVAAPEGAGVASVSSDPPFL